MGCVISLRPAAISRQQFIESVIALGAEDGARMNLPCILDAARASAWREVNRIAGECCDHGWCPVERTEFPLLDTVDSSVRPDLVDACALVAACDRLLADFMPKPRDPEIVEEAGR